MFKVLVARVAATVIVIVGSVVALPWLVWFVHQVMYKLF